MTHLTAVARGKIAAGAITVLIAIAAFALALKLSAFGDEPASRPRPSCSGPWSVCAPDALWLRQVLAKAGFPDPGPGTGSALIVPQESPIAQRYFWAVRHKPDPDAYSAYEVFHRVGETDIYGNQEHLFWRAQGRTVFLQPAPDRQLLTKLVRLTAVVPAPADEASD